MAPCTPRAPSLGGHPGASLGHGAAGSGLTVPWESRAAPAAALGGSMEVLLGDATFSLHVPVVWSMAGSTLPLPRPIPGP